MTNRFDSRFIPEHRRSVVTGGQPGQWTRKISKSHMRKRGSPTKHRLQSAEIARWVPRNGAAGKALGRGNQRIEEERGLTEIRTHSAPSPPLRSPGTGGKRGELGSDGGGRDDGAASVSRNCLTDCSLPLFLSVTPLRLICFSLEFVTGTSAPTNDILPRDVGSSCPSPPCGTLLRCAVTRAHVSVRRVGTPAAIRFAAVLTEYSENSSSRGGQLWRVEFIRCYLAYMWGLRITAERWIAVWAVPAFLGNMLLPSFSGVGGRPTGRVWLRPLALKTWCSRGICLDPMDTDSLYGDWPFQQSLSFYAERSVAIVQLAYIVSVKKVILFYSLLLCVHIYSFVLYVHTRVDH
jgi:hypothetical protein